MLTAQGRLGEARKEFNDTVAAMRADPDTSPITWVWVGFIVAEKQRIEGDFAGLRDSMSAIYRGGRWEDQPNAAVLLSKLALACTQAPNAACPVDLVARADAKLAEPLHRDHPWRIEAQLALTQRALAQGDAQQALVRLADIRRVAALPHARLPPTHRWLAEARMWQGDALSARGDGVRASQAWRAADAIFADRYRPGHPFRRHLASRLSPVTPQ
jgi:hypothetical protein